MVRRTIHSLRYFFVKSLSKKQKFAIKCPQKSLTLQRDDLPGGLHGAPGEAGEVTKVVRPHVQDGQGVDVDVGRLLHLGGLEAAAAAVAGVHVADWRGETNSN